MSKAITAQIDMGRIAEGEIVMLQQADLDRAIDARVTSIEQSVAGLLRDAGVTAAGIDTVFFTGDSSSVPLLRQRILALTPQARCVEGDLFGSIGADLGLDAQAQIWPASFPYARLTGRPWPARPRALRNHQSFYRQ